MLRALPAPKESWTAAARTAFRAGKASISFRTDLWRPALAAIFLSCTALAGKAVQAQQRSAPASLEELIPDAAVENPEGWAGGQTVADTGESTAPAPDAALDEGTDIALPWPDEVDLPPVETLEPDPGFRFAEEGFDLPPVQDTGKEVRLSSELTLVFPPSDEEFPVRKEFTSRFEALSVVEGLEGVRDNIALLSTRARQDEALLDRLLRNYGYYDGQILRSLGGLQPGEDEAAAKASVRFDIAPGPLYRFGTIELGALDTAPDYEALRRSFEIQPGDPLLADRIVQESFDLDSALGESGYPFAAIGNPSLLIDHDRQEGDLTLPVTPGGKYRFGHVISSRTKFLSSHHLESIARFEPGDIYMRSDEMDLRRAILSTGLVSSVTITPRETQAPQGDTPGTVDLDVALEKAKLRTIAGGLGYSTGEGITARASWEHRNFFPPEGALRLRAVAGTREQLAGVTFRRNNVNGRDRILTLDAYASTTDRAAYQARTAAMLATYERISTLLFQKPFTWSIGAEIIATDERVPKVKGGKNPRTTYLIAALPLQAQIDTSDSLLDPTGGFRVGGRLSPEISTEHGHQLTYIRSQFDLSAYQQLGDTVVLAGRARVGTIIGAPIADIALSRRLYAGGGGSVRGFGYQQIGPRNGVGDPNGGRSLVEFSLEARVRTGMFDGALSVVPFLDAGAVSRSSTPGFSDMRYGAGLGVRYQTGFGPIRVDVATPINPEPGDGPVAVYVALGQAF